PGSESETKDLQQAAQALGIRLEVLRASADRDLDAAFATLVERRAAALLVGNDEVEVISPFRKGLKEAGVDESRNVSLEFRFAESDVTRLPSLAAESVSRKVQVIFAASPAAALAAKTATSTVPIVFATGADPIQSGLVARLNRPGGNLTGVSFF